MSAATAKEASVPRVSIVIAHFNRAELLQQTLDSIRAQSFHDWEVVVVDDGSQPDELQKIQEMQDEKIRILQRTENPKGPSTARNTGVKMARGEYVMFVDSDDLIAPWCLEQRLTRAAAEPQNAFWVFPVMLFEQQMGDVSLQWNDLRGDDDLMRFLHSDPPWHTSSPLWKRAALQELGGFNVEVMYGDDADLHARALLKNLPYEKYCDALPDSFVRRDNSPRITNTHSDALLKSRRMRLREGSMAVADAPKDQKQAWEGQYFAEAEFLLFNLDQPNDAIRRLMELWLSSHRPLVLRRAISGLYLKVAQLTKQRAYILLRIARRIAMAMLPKDYFPSAPGFQTTEVPAEILQKIKSAAADTQLIKTENVDATVSA